MKTTPPAPAASTTITTIASHGDDRLDDVRLAGSARTEVAGDRVVVSTAAVDPADVGGAVAGARVGGGVEPCVAWTVGGGVEWCVGVGVGVV